MKTFKIYTLGCKVNQYDSQVIREQLQRRGLSELSNNKPADCYIINTCTVTNSADSQSRNLIRVSIRENPFAKIVVTGCYAHSNVDDIRNIEGVSLILNNDDKFNISKHIFPNTDKKTTEKIEISDFKGHTRAFVKVQDGCNNFCSFCKVPYVRGRSRTRDIASIVSEIKRLRDKDYKEIVLTGICLGDFGKDLKEKIDLVDLIEEIENIEGILRIRLSSMEAKDITQKLIGKMKSSNKLCPHLHIPFQSGDNRILRAMNRRDTKETYLELVRRLRHHIYNIGISADIMIGFPQETDSQFQNTLDLLKEVVPLRTHIFTFNPRDCTALANRRDTIPQAILKQRYLQIKSLTDELSLNFKKRFNNQVLDVLFEEKKNGFWQGYSQNYLPILLNDAKGINLCNSLVKVKVTEVSPAAIKTEVI